MQTDKLSPRQLFGLVLAALLFVVSLGLYSAHGNSYAPAEPPANSLTVTNPLVLQNWLPPASYKYTVARLNDYAKSQQIDASSITIQSPVESDQGAYGFTVSFDPNPSKYRIDVLINNFNSVISTSVNVNGATQSVTIPTTTGKTSYSGVNSLLNAGLTSIQANELQTAFTKYDDHLSTVRISTASVTTDFDNSSSPPNQLMKFAVTLDGKDYNAVVDYTDLTSISLKLYDQSSGDQIFDSGKIDSSS